MKITELNHIDKDDKTIEIELSAGEMVRHLESSFEETARKVYQRSKRPSDMLFWLSEWAKTEEEHVNS